MIDSKTRFLFALLFVLGGHSAIASSDVEPDVNARSQVQVAHNAVATDQLKRLSELFKKGDEEILSEILMHGPNVDVVNKYGMTPLFMAVMGNLQEATRMLLAAGAKTDVLKPKSNGTPLFFAAQKGNFEIVRALVNAGADVNLPTRRGLTPLFIAAVMNADGIVVTLLEAKADPNIGDKKKGIAPLYIAAERGNVGIVEKILEAGAMIDHQSVSGATALYVAAAKGHIEAVEHLVANGANPHLSLKVEDGVQSPLIIAKANRHDAVVKFLERGLPKCSRRADIDDWAIFFTESFFTIETDVEVEAANRAHRKLKIIFTRKSDGRIAYNLMAGKRNEKDTFQMFADSRKIHEGRYAKEKLKNGGSSLTMSPINDFGLQAMLSGQLGEVRVAKDLGKHGIYVVSGAFSLEEFSEAFDFAMKSIKEMNANMLTGRCRAYYQDFLWVAPF